LCTVEVLSALVQDTDGYEISPSVCLLRAFGHHIVKSFRLPDVCLGRSSFYFHGETDFHAVEFRQDTGWDACPCLLKEYESISKADL
jgi:hypothetical protein